MASINPGGLGILPIGSVGIVMGIAKDVGALAYGSQALLPKTGRDQSGKYLKR
jgi:hypothetical protein